MADTARLYTYEVEFVQNMNNYESLRTREGLTEPAREGETADELRDRVRGKVNAWIFQAVEDNERELRGMRSRLDVEQSRTTKVK